MVNLSVIGLRGFPGIEGGVERHCESLYPKLKGDINVTIYRRKPYVSTGGSYNNIHFVDFPSTKTKGLEPFFHSFLASVHAMLKKPDVVHYHNIGPALFSPIMKLRSIPVMLTYHSPNYEHKKWGYIADVARLDILYQYGGIYMDTDVELIRNPDKQSYQTGF